MSAISAERRSLSQDSKHKKYWHSGLGLIKQINILVIIAGKLASTRNEITHENWES